jgi:hypothetical protein
MTVSDMSSIVRMRRAGVADKAPRAAPGVRRWHRHQMNDKKYWSIAARVHIKREFAMRFEREAIMRPTFVAMLFASGVMIAGVSGVSEASVVNGAVIGRSIEASELVQQAQERFHRREESREREHRREESREREHRREESREREHRREESRERR